MKCQICNSESSDKYCDNCRHIRCVYVIHKLSEKISLNEKFNTNTLIIKKLKNIEKYDLDLLVEYNILSKDRLNNYKWISVDDINDYLSEHDKSGKKISLKEDKKEKIPAIDEIVMILTDNYNITDTLELEDLSKLLKTGKNQTKKIIQKLTDNDLINKTFYGKYKLNYSQIIRYKKEHNITDNKIKTLKNIKQTSNESTITNITDKSKKKSDKAKTKKKTSSSNEKTINKKEKNSDKNSKEKNNTADKTIKEKNSIIDADMLSKEDKTIPLIRDYINNRLLILPRNVNVNDLTLNDLYEEYKEYSDTEISHKDFMKYFHMSINTYPHIRHKRYEDTYKYNIKSRKTPQLTLDKLQENSEKFTYNKDSSVILKENTLKISRDIENSELAQLYNLIIYTYENIVEYNYHKNDDKIHIEITYDLNDENPDLWLKFLKSYNL